MITAMLNGVTGINSFNQWLDVVSNNLANISTTGYKESRVAFRDIHDRTLTLGSSPKGMVGGINPEQVGFGASVASISKVFTQGDLMLSGNKTDLAIEGNGFFILADNSGKIGNPDHTFYSRAGAFDIDSDGNLVDTNTGYLVLGYMADPNDPASSIDTGKLTQINIKNFGTLSPKATSSTEISGNLSAQAEVGEEANVGFSTYDSQGVSHNIQMVFKKEGDNSWTWEAKDIDGNSLGTGSLAFGTDGKLISGTTSTLSLTDGNSINMDFSGISQFGGPAYLNASYVDGHGAGGMVDISVGRDGIIYMDYNDGSQREVAQIALSNFTNPGGLVSMGDTFFKEGINSGKPLIGLPGTDSRGAILGSTLEMSNVNPANEMVNLILAQRGYQINSKVITTADSIVQDALNLPRR